jgi:prophage regulatory protein
VATIPLKTSPRRLLLSADDLRDLGIRYSRAQLHKMMARGRFPKPVRISDQRNAWVLSEVEAWRARRRGRLTEFDRAADAPRPGLGELPMTTRTRTWLGPPPRHRSAPR